MTELPCFDVDPVTIWYNRRLNILYLLVHTWIGEGVSGCCDESCEHSFEDLHNKYSDFIGEFE